MFTKLYNVVCRIGTNKAVDDRKVHTNCTQILTFNKNKKDGKC